MTNRTSNIVDLTLRVIGVSMGIASVTLMLIRAITVETAVILLGIGIVSMGLERLTEKG